jgi:L-iditol 2-dehydrogenase
MKASLLLGPGQIAIDQVPDPNFGADEVMIQCKCVGICGTDVSFFKGHRSVPYPFVLGHEIAGCVTAVGKNVTKISVGQRVIVEPNYPCGKCRLCLEGRGAVCPDKKSMGVNLPGCFSEYVVAPAEFVWPLPDAISYQDAATMEPLAVSMHGLLQSRAQEGDTIAVLGCGVVGLLLVHAAVASGVRVIAHDKFAGKLEMARRLGAATESGNFDPAQLWRKKNVIKVFECAGTPETVELALDASPRGAQIVLLGLSSEPACFRPIRLVREGINISTSMIYDHPVDFARSIDWVAKGILHPGTIVTHTFSFDAIKEALELAGSGEAGKVHILVT